MAHRKSKDGLPANLYRRQQNGRWYYQYRDTRDGRFHGLGYDRKTAIRQAEELNSLIAAQTANQRVQVIIERKSQKAQSINWHTALQKYWQTAQQRHADGELSANTLRTRKSHIKALASLPNWQLDSTSHQTMLSDTNQLLEDYKTQDKHRTAQSIRSCMIDVFKELRSQGYWTQTLDPATATRNPKAIVKRMRLTLDLFQHVLNKVRSNKRFDPWLEHAMLLAITTSHCNAELSRLTYTEQGTGCWIDDNHLYITRQKVRNSRVRIPLDFGLDAIGYSIREIIEMTHSQYYTASHIIHHQRTTTKAKAGQVVHPNTYSRRFRDALTQCDITIPDGMTAPTFYELRSLCERLAKQQGVDTQTLLGHKQARTTAVYDDPRDGFKALKM